MVSWSELEVCIWNTWKDRFYKEHIEAKLEFTTDCANNPDHALETLYDAL